MESWVLVPRTPNGMMLGAGHRNGGENVACGRIYAAMIETAPSPEAKDIDTESRLDLLRKLYGFSHDEARYWDEHGKDSDREGQGEVRGVPDGPSAADRGELPAVEAKPDK